MARLESINFTPHHCFIEGGGIEWRPALHQKKLMNLPHIFWADGSPWNEANQWFYYRLTSDGVGIRTAESNASGVHAYANWLESTNSDWRNFPVRKADRCLVRFRGALVSARDQGLIASSTAQQRMNAVINFYRWLKLKDLVSPAWPMWKERKVSIPFHDSVGFERTITVNTTDLSLPNRKAPGERLEDGLLPISSIDRDKLLRFAKEHCSQELFLMLSLGFFTGMRIGTLCDLRIETLENAAPERSSPLLLRIAIGPNASPSVATKFGVTGQIPITRQHLDQLLNYAHSVRRLKREVIAKPEDKNLVFLTRFGNPYSQRGSDIRSKSAHFSRIRSESAHFQKIRSILLRTLRCSKCKGCVARSTT